LVEALAYLQVPETPQRECLWPQVSDGALARTTAYLAGDRETLMQELAFVLPGLPTPEAIAIGKKSPPG
jgi:hypothetical protein